MLTPTEALKEALDIIEWMSGSADFAAEGQAHGGWQSAQAKIADIKVATMEAAKLKLLPDAIEIDLKVYVTSPGSGLNSRIVIGGRRDTDYGHVDFDALQDLAVAALNEMGEVTDARAMTREEVKAYEADEARGEREDADDGEDD